MPISIFNESFDNQCLMHELNYNRTKLDIKIICELICWLERGKYLKSRMQYAHHIFEMQAMMAIHNLG